MVCKEGVAQKAKLNVLVIVASVNLRRTGERLTPPKNKLCSNMEVLSSNV